MFKFGSHVLVAAVACFGVCGNLAAVWAAEDQADGQAGPSVQIELTKETGSSGGSGLKNRAKAADRAACVKKYGGNEASEAAVAAGLKWLAAAQAADGGWNFDHRFAKDAAIREADHPGNMTGARNAATAMALLPFLGAGQTHSDGKYKKTVFGGLGYLMSHMKKDGSMHESAGNLYSHGLASIALNEAYALTHDKKLLVPAQASVNFIAYAQDPVGGGWRYQPRQSGDTSVTGWQLMALKSGHMAYLQISPNTVRGATKFLDSVQAGDGAYYGYTTPGKRGATTAIGLLCRMYLGWPRDREALEKGVKYLSAQGPSSTNMYHNYYATQVMFQYGGEHWDKWNGKMRDHLVNAQDKTGPAKGSWHFAGGHGADRGGRIYNTSLAIMILEVYYRHARIYEKKSANKK